MSRLRPIAVFDVDGAFIRKWWLRYKLRAMMERGMIPVSVYEALERSERKYQNREGSYAEHLNAQIDVYDRHIGGIVAAEIRALSREIVKRHGREVYCFPRELFHAAKEAGYGTALISGSTIEIVQPFAELWGFDAARGTEHEIGPDGKYTGDAEKIRKVVTRKGEVLLELAEELGCTLTGSLANGDTFSDSSMLEKVEYPGAFMPDKNLDDAAEKKGFPIITECRDVIRVERFGRRIPLREAYPAAIHERLYPRLHAAGFKAY